MAISMRYAWTELAEKRSCGMARAGRRAYLANEDNIPFLLEQKLIKDTGKVSSLSNY